MSERDVLVTLEESLAAALLPGRERVEVGPFDLFIRRDSAAEHLNVAMPRRPAASWPEPIRRLVAAFEARGRRPRLEYFDERYPALAPALQTHGFHEEMRAPVMALRPEGLAPPTEVEGARFRRLDPADPATIATFLRQQSIAFGGEGGDDSLDWLPLLQEGLASGSHLALAVEIDGEMLSGATIQVGTGAGELAGVWTLPAHRRRGLARAVCAHLLADIFDSGLSLAWLSASEDGLQLYERLGFKRCGTQVNLSRPHGVQAARKLGSA